jgi:hypothetical protein
MMLYRADARRSEKDNDGTGFALMDDLCVSSVPFRSKRELPTRSSEAVFSRHLASLENRGLLHRVVPYQETEANISRGLVFVSQGIALTPLGYRVAMRPVKRVSKQ